MKHGVALQSHLTPMSDFIKFAEKELRKDLYKSTAIIKILKSARRSGHGAPSAVTSRLGASLILIYPCSFSAFVPERLGLGWMQLLSVYENRTFHWNLHVIHELPK